MIGAGALALVLVAGLSEPVSPTDLETYEQVQTAAWWTLCCAPFRGALPSRLQHRIERVMLALRAKYGSAAVDAASESAKRKFDENFGLFDPSTRRLSRSESRASRSETVQWYDARLRILEVSLGIAK